MIGKKKFTHLILQNKPPAVLAVCSGVSNIFDLAVWMGKTYLCAEKSFAPCDTCKNCLTLDRNEHPDFKHLDTTILENGNIKVNDISILNSFFQLTSSQGGVRVFSMGLLENVNATVQNTLLKTLEEPPENLKLILFTMAASAVPLTIKSRCQIIDFRQDFKKEAELSIVKFRELDAVLLPILFQCDQISPSVAAQKCQNFELMDIIDRVILWTHDFLLVGANCPPLVFNSAEPEFIKVFKTIKSRQTILEAGYAILEMKRFVLNNLNKVLFLENIFIEFKNGFK